MTSALPEDPEELQKYMDSLIKDVEKGFARLSNDITTKIEGMNKRVDRLDVALTSLMGPAANQAAASKGAVASKAK